MAFEELKRRQSVMWGSGPFERVEEGIAAMRREELGRAFAAYSESQRLNGGIVDLRLYLLTLGRRR